MELLDSYEGSFHPPSAIHFVQAPESVAKSKVGASHLLARCTPVAQAVPSCIALV